VVMVRLKMSETLREAVTFIEQGHVRVGPDTGACGLALLGGELWGCRCCRGCGARRDCVGPRPAWVGGHEGASSPPPASPPPAPPRYLT
jgi:hypothetical protein